MILSRTEKASILLLLFVSLLFVTNGAVAQDTTGENLGILDQMVEDFLENASRWESAIANAAMWLFYVLMAIDFSWMAIQSAFKRSEIDELVAEVVKRVLTYGFFLMLLENSPQWAGFIVDSMVELASTASGIQGQDIELSPSAVVEIGIRLSGNLFSQISYFEFGDALVYWGAGSLMFLIFVAIAIEFTLALVIVWVKIYTGQLLLGLGSTKWTQDYAINYYRSALGSGFKLFIISLMVHVGVSSVDAWVAASDQDMSVGAALAIFAGLALLWALVKSAGEITQSLFQGQASQSNAVDVANSITHAAHALHSAALTASKVTGGTIQAGGGAVNAAFAAKDYVNANSSGPSSLGTAMANAASKVGAGAVGQKVAQSVGDTVTGLAKGAAVLGKGVAAEAMTRASGTGEGGYARQYGSFLGQTADSMRGVTPTDPNTVRKGKG